MRTIEINLYKFDELGEEAKKKAIQDQRNWQNEFGEPLHFFAEDCETTLKEKGFIGTDVQWSLGYSQGDGLSFSAEDYENLYDLYLEVLGKGKEKTAKLLTSHTEMRITGNMGRYCFASESDVRLWTSKLNVKHVDEVLQKVEGKLQEIYLNACKELERAGYDQIEYSTSDEAITEFLIANEYEFEINGKKY